MTHVDPKALAELKARVSEAALVPTLWGEVLEEIAERIGAAAVSLGYLNGQGFAKWHQSPLLDPPFRTFVDTMPNELTRIRRFLEGGHKGFVSDEDLFTEEEILELPLFNSIMRPHDIQGGISTVSRTRFGHIAVLSFERAIGDPPFGSDIISMLNQLLPTITQSLSISAALQFERVHIAYQTLEMIGASRKLIDDFHQTISQDPLIETMLRKENKGRMTSDCAGKASPAAEASGGPNILLNDMEATGRSSRPFKVSIATIARTLDERLPALKTLESLLDLTRSEAVAARGIARGLSVVDLAQEMSIKEATVRQHLKSIYRKVGVSSQAQLVSVINWASHLTHAVESRLEFGGNNSCGRD